MSAWNKCNSCGRFLSHKDKEARVWTRWASSAEFAPPEPTLLCGRCWAKKSSESKARLERPNATWIPIRRVYE